MCAYYKNTIIKLGNRGKTHKGGVAQKDFRLVQDKIKLDDVTISVPVHHF